MLLICECSLQTLFGVPVNQESNMKIPLFHRLDTELCLFNLDPYSNE